MVPDGKKIQQSLSQEIISEEQAQITNVTVSMSIQTEK